MYDYSAALLKAIKIARRIAASKARWHLQHIGT